MRHHLNVPDCHAPTVLFLSFTDLTLTHLSSPECFWGFQIVFRFESGWRLTGGDTNREARWCPVCQTSLIHLQKLWRDWDKKARPNLFPSVASLSFLWLAPVCLSTAELLAVSNQCVHFSLLPPLLSSFFLPSLLLSLPPSSADRSDIRNLYYQVFPGCWWKSWFATPDWI